MTMLNTVFLNILIGFLGRTVIYEGSYFSEFDYNDILHYLMYGFNFIQLFYLISIVWRGSRFNQLFSKCNIAFMMLFFLVDIAFIVLEIMNIKELVANYDPQSAERVYL